MLSPLTRTIPLQTPNTSPTPAHALPRPRPVGDRARQTDRPLRILLIADRDALRRDVERLVQEALDRVNGERVRERRDVRLRDLAERRAAVRDVDQQRRGGRGVAAEEGWAFREVPCDEARGRGGYWREGVRLGEEVRSVLGNLQGCKLGSIDISRVEWTYDQRGSVGEVILCIRRLKIAHIESRFAH